MVQRVQLRRLSRADYDGIAAAHQKCAVTIGMLQHTNWAGAPACAVLVGDIDRFLCELFNKTESSLNRSLGLDPVKSPEEASPELAAAADAGQGEIAAPAKPQEEP